MQSQFPSQRKHLETLLDEQRRSYETVTARIKAIDTDARRELDSERLLILRERRKELDDEREEIFRRMKELEIQLAGVAESEVPDVHSHGKNVRSSHEAPIANPLISQLVAAVPNMFRNSTVDGGRTKLLGELEAKWLPKATTASRWAGTLSLSLQYKSGYVDKYADPNSTQTEAMHDDEITEAFYAARKELLLLGNEGAGKSTILLKLASSLAKKARADMAQPVPIYLSLSNWQPGKRGLDAWIIEQVQYNYHIDGESIDQLLQDARLTILLDDLDKVEGDEERGACVKEINRFLEANDRHSIAGIVVCCKTVQYACGGELLHLNAALEVQPLTTDDLEHHFSAEGERLSALRTALDGRPDLWQLAQSPFVLDLMAHVCQERSVQDLFSADTNPEQKTVILIAASTQILLNEMERLPNYHYSRKQTIRSLNWLAENLHKRNLPLFLVERIQANWLLSSSSDRTHVLIPRLTLVLFWFVLALIGIVFGFAIKLPLIGLSFGIGLIILASVAVDPENEVQPVEVLEWSWHGLRRGVVLMMVYGIAVASAIVVIAWRDSSTIRPLVQFFLMVWIPCCLIIGLVIPLKDAQFAEISDVERKAVSEGLIRSRKNAFRIGCRYMIVLPILLFIVFLGASVLTGMIRDALQWAIRGALLGVGIACVVWLRFGGYALIQHQVLRFALQRKGYLPRASDEFFQLATKANLIRRVDGGYDFLHSAWRSYFASSETLIAETTGSKAADEQSASTLAPNQ